MALFEVPVAGGTPSAVFERTAPLSVSRSATDGASIYWFDGVERDPFYGTVVEASLLEVGLAGGAISTLASHLSGPAGLAVEGSSVFWTASNEPRSPGRWHSSVVRLPVSGGTPTTLATTGGSTEGAGTLTIAVDGTSVYWATYDAVLKVPLNGGTPTTVASGQRPVKIAVDATSVYWTNWDGTSDTGTVMKRTPK